MIAPSSQIAVRYCCDYPPISSAPHSRCRYLGYTIICPRFWANQYTKPACCVYVAFPKAMGRLSHDVGWHSRDIAN
jgi:hypothetical protein